MRLGSEIRGLRGPPEIPKITNCSQLSGQYLTCTVGLIQTVWAP